MGLAESESPETVALILGLFANLVFGRGQGRQGGKGSVRIQRALNQNLRNCHESETSPPPPRRLGAEIAHLGILTLLYSISS